MVRKILFIICLLTGSVVCAQQMFYLPVGSPVEEDTEKMVRQGPNKIITGVVRPAIEVYLPDAGKSNGCAVILCPGGALRSLVWSTDVEQMARFLNERGIAAIGLKYRLNTTPFPRGAIIPPTVDVTGFERFPKADANPLHYPAGDSLLMLAASDARAAVRMVRQKAEEWNIDMHKIGFLGFSAGAGVALAAALQTEDAMEKPDFMCTNYGPALTEVNVTSSAPPLLIMSRVDHPNVAAGLLSLFLEWKKAGAQAELHLYDEGKGPYSLMPHTGKTTTENWSNHFILWLQAKGFVQ